MQIEMTLRPTSTAWNSSIIITYLLTLPTCT